MSEKMKPYEIVLPEPSEAVKKLRQEMDDAIIKINQDILRRWPDVNNAPLRPHVVLAEEAKAGNFTTLSKNDWITPDPDIGKATAIYGFINWPNRVTEDDVVEPIIVEGSK